MFLEKLSLYSIAVALGITLCFVLLAIWMLPEPTTGENFQVGGTFVEGDILFFSHDGQNHTITVTEGMTYIDVQSEIDRLTND